MCFACDSSSNFTASLLEYQFLYTVSFTVKNVCVFVCMCVCVWLGHLPAGPGGRCGRPAPSGAEGTPGQGESVCVCACVCVCVFLSVFVSDCLSTIWNRLMAPQTHTLWSGRHAWTRGGLCVYVRACVWLCVTSVAANLVPLVLRVGSDKMRLCVYVCACVFLCIPATDDRRWWWRWVTILNVMTIMAARRVIMLVACKEAGRRLGSR